MSGTDTQAGPSPRGPGMAQVSSCVVGRYLFGVDVALVQEIMRVRSITPVPLAVPEIAGLINLRGEVLTAVDLRIGLGLPVDSSRASTLPDRLLLALDARKVLNDLEALAA